MNQWISVNDRLPNHGDMVLIVFGENRMIALARYYMTTDRRWLEACYGREEYSPDFWQPLPAVPPKPDPFEQWWNNLPNSPYGQEVKQFFNRVIEKGHAKLVWDAAVESVMNKSPRPVTAHLPAFGRR